jgi:hypothetical protein
VLAGSCYTREMSSKSKNKPGLMHRPKSRSGIIERAKHIVLDALGILLMIISPLFGWLPGPGGIPVFVAGLALLAVNHEWAKRWLASIKEKGMDIMDAVFVRHPIWEAFYDLATVVCVVVGVHLLNSYTRNLTITIGILLLIVALFLFFGNRQRMRRLLKRFNKSA